MLTIYNSISRQKEPFAPIRPGHIGLYVCGITVYDYCHLGHARAMVSFDVIVRFLRSQGYQVNYVRNITDIDDKIIVRAQERGVSIGTLTAQFIDAMHEDARQLNILPPDVEPRATAHISEIIQLISRLIENGHAYVSENGDVCFEVATFESYGKLAQKELEGLMAGSRVDIVKEKRSPLDFVLWKKAKPNEPSWDSPWGPGRPGWHIECSAMSMSELGEHFDIHGGGLDLQFPHHENEIAQSEGATKHCFANYWMHIGLLQVNHEKMAKSTGNFFTIQDVLKRHHPEVIRYFLISSHYRSPLNYSEENLSNAEKALTRLYQSIKDIQVPPTVAIEERWVNDYTAAMADDFNTPEALSVLFKLCHEINTTKSPSLVATLKQLAQTLGLLNEPPVAFLQRLHAEVDTNQIEHLIAERLTARQQRDWAKADDIRASLLTMGIELEDGSEGTTWRRA